MLVCRVQRQRTKLERGYRPQFPQPNDTSGNIDKNTMPIVPDEQCLFDPSLLDSAADPEGDALGASFLNYRDQCVPIRSPEFLNNKHHEDDEKREGYTRF